MHVGASDVNYDIVDNDVERDAVNGLPIIHASGVKGAMRDHFETVGGVDIASVFGARGRADESVGGTHKFLDAMLISRPMRVYGSDRIASIPVVTVDSVNGFLKRISDFGCNSLGVTELSPLDFGGNEFLTSVEENIKVENEPTGKLPENVKAELSKLSSIIGVDFAVVKSFDGYELPVVARNCLEGQGNLWYERVVPHGSVFVFAIIYPDGAESLNFKDSIVQFGGNASVGCGYSRIEQIG